MPNIYDDYYKKFIDELKIRKSEFPDFFQIPTHQGGRYYLGYNSGIANVKFYTEYTTKGYSKGYKGFITGIYIDGDNYLEKFNQLKNSENEIEKKLHQKLYWLDTDRAGRIFTWQDKVINNKE